MKSFEKNNRQNRKGEQGNVLFFILLGVVLFAALSFTVGNMLRGDGAETIGEEKARLVAGEIVDYGRAMRQAVQDMRISNGCEDTQLSFENNMLLEYTNPSTTTDRCKIFHPSGGDLNYVVPSLDWLSTAEWESEPYFQEWFITPVCAPTMPYAELGERCENNPFHDLIVLLPYLNQEVCEQINRMSSIEGMPLDAHKVGLRGYFTGSYGTDGAQHQHNALIDIENRLVGKMSGCFQSTAFPPAYALNEGKNPYIFYQVLLER